MRFAFLLLLVAVTATSGLAQTRPRGRDLGIPFPGETGPANAITDVAGIAVGHVTLIEGEGKLVPGKGPIRTGVTAILPRPRGNWDPVFAATFNLNGNGDMTGINWIKESGFLEGPILLTGHAQRRHGARRGDPVAAEERPRVRLHLSRSSPRRSTS